MESPIYNSESKAKNLWQRYSIFSDGVEFKTLFGTISIPFEHIESVEVHRSDVEGLLKGDLGLKDFKPALKLDWANFTEHVVVDKKDGFCKRFLFTPDDPEEFKHLLEAAMKNHERR